MRLNQVSVPCTNVAHSVEFYTKLGLIQIVASDHYDLQARSPARTSPRPVRRTGSPAPRSRRSQVLGRSRQRSHSKSDSIRVELAGCVGLRQSGWAGVRLSGLGNGLGCCRSARLTVGQNLLADRVDGCHERNDGEHRNDGLDVPLRGLRAGPILSPNTARCLLPRCQDGCQAQRSRHRRASTRELPTGQRDSRLRRRHTERRCSPATARRWRGRSPLRRGGDAAAPAMTGVQRGPQRANPRRQCQSNSPPRRRPS